MKEGIEVNPIVAGLLVDVAALAVIGVALAMGAPWDKVSPAFYALIGARAAVQARKALEPPAPPPSSSGASPPAPPAGSIAPGQGGVLRELALTSGVVALLIALPAALAARARTALAVVLLVALVGMPLSACGLTAREALTASLEAANAAIVAAANEVDAEEQRQEAACQVAASDVDACIAKARKLNAVLDAYNRYAAIWPLFRLIYNAVGADEPSAEASAAAAQLGCSAVDDACVATAQGKIESARAEFYAAKAIAGGP